MITLLKDAIFNFLLWCFYYLICGFGVLLTSQTKLSILTEIQYLLGRGLNG